MPSVAAFRCRQLPREIQWHILSYVGWWYGDALALRAKVARLARHNYVVSAVNLGTLDLGMLYRYSMPKWCARCGEYREHACVKCIFCGNVKYAMVGWM